MIKLSEHKFEDHTWETFKDGNLTVCVKLQNNKIEHVTIDSGVLNCFFDGERNVYSHPHNVPMNAGNRLHFQRFVDKCSTIIHNIKQYPIVWKGDENDKTCKR